MPRPRIELTVGLPAVDDPRVTEIPVPDPRIRAFILNGSERDGGGKAPERVVLRSPLDPSAASRP